MRRILILDNYRSSAEILRDYLRENEDDELDVRIATTHASAQETLQTREFDKVYITSDMPLRRAVKRHCPEAIIETVNLDRVADRSDKEEVLEALLYVPKDPYDF